MGPKLSKTVQTLILRDTLSTSDVQTSIKFDDYPDHTLCLEGAAAIGHASIMREGRR